MHRSKAFRTAHLVFSFLSVVVLEHGACPRLTIEDIVSV